MKIILYNNNEIGFNICFINNSNHVVIINLYNYIINTLRFTMDKFIIYRMMKIINSFNGIIIITQI